MRESRLDDVRRAALACGMSQVLLGPDAWREIVPAAREQGLRRVLIVQDRTVILRAGEHLKELVADRLSAAGLEVSTTVIDEDDPHTTPAHIQSVRDSLRGGTTVIALGSGTVVDIAKRALHEWETETGDRLRLVSVQTANSVCAYTSGMSVVTVDGVKRTLPSRLPDVLVLDTQTLSDAPEEYTLGGVGDNSVAAASFADYRLCDRLGLGWWEPASWELMRPGRDRFLALDPAFSAGADRAETLAVELSACGLAMTLAGESAPLSGLEHVTSHTLDMSAARDGRPIGNHGSQCAVATILSLIAFDLLLSSKEPPIPDLTRLDETDLRDTVRRAFTPVSADDRVWRECWKDYSVKLRSWNEHGDVIASALGSWDVLREDLRRYTVEPARFVAALTAAGHPVRFEEIPSGISTEMARWAFTHARLMRKRTTVSDVLAFAGRWTETFLDEVFEVFETITRPQAGASPRP
ncbi:iron-containing alcohol dehydrogenase [Propionicicella superfundia]|uniref:iron-containing alcohol dehydrogenase n=1 Tax=Propionicicella superfundia TaxID=348582 RepID=UPI0004080926|nr:iron-containing alcohol dehydrogenase [Propionicicella superfundia]